MALLLAIFLPTPFCFKLGMQEFNVPSCLFSDLVEYFKNFFLFTTIDKAFPGDSKGSNGDACDTSIFDVCYDTTYLMCVTQ